MKVLNVVMDNHIGGPQIRVLSVAKELRKYEIETIMLCPKGEGDFAQQARQEHFKVHQIMLYGPKFFNRFVSIIGNIKWFFTFPFTVYIIMKIISNERIDIVHVNGLLNLQAPIAGFLTKRKIVWHLISSLYPKSLVILLRPFINIIATEKVVVAEKLGKYYLGDDFLSNRKGVSIIYEGIDIKKFDPSVIPSKSQNKIIAELNLTSSDTIIGCIGNVHSVKGYEYFIKAANDVRKSINNVKFIIVGDIPDSQKQYYIDLQKLVSSLGMDECILFTGKRNDIPEMLKIFDLFVLPSVAEGTPLVILEAMAMEKAVISTDVGAISEQVLDKITGIVVPPKNYRALSEAIISLIQKPEESIIMGQKGRIRVENLFSLEVCAEKHLTVYKI